MNRFLLQISTDFDLKTDSGICLAMDDFKAGDQVWSTLRRPTVPLFHWYDCLYAQIFIYYGSRSNGEFFVHNGFVYKDNSNDFVPLRLGISKNDSLYQQKYELCKRLDLNVSGVYRLYEKPKPIDRKLLAFLRVFHFNEGICRQITNAKLIHRIIAYN